MIPLAEGHEVLWVLRMERLLPRLLISWWVARSSS
jgi:hypothetical protein